MDFELLGVVAARTNGALVDIGSPQRRTVLAVLLVEAGSPVSVEALVDRVWGESLPAHPVAGLYSHISGLRQALEPVCDDPPVKVAKVPGGYLLDTDRSSVDLLRFQTLIDHASVPDRPADERLVLLREAMSLWQGCPLGGLPTSCRWAEQERERVRRQHVDAAVLWAQLELSLHPPEGVIDVLHRLVGEHPLVEPLAGSLIKALALAGRVPEALECYATVQRRLRDELGIFPGAELQQLHRELLRNDSTHARAAAPARVTTPAQLPVGVADFVGRTAELARLDIVLGDAASPVRSVVVAALSGAAGVGKTSLALHWAHQARERFPDGQLYVDLRGFDPSGRPLHPEVALRTLLTSLGAAPEEIPLDLASQVGMYRSLLADRRVLVVLDNAFDSEQASSLLPGSPKCAAVITSRSQLGGLTVRGAHLLTLGLMDEAEAREMLTRRVGLRRVEREPDAVDSLLRVSAGLPLALGIVCARIAAQPGVALAALAAELAEESHRLDALDAGELSADLRAVFSWSYQALDPRSARAFRLSGLAPGPDFGLSAAAALLGADRSRTRVLLRHLTAVNLLQQHGPDRYRLHDLVRLYALDRVRIDEPEASRAAAHRRIADFYLHTADSAALKLRPRQDRAGLPPAQRGVVPEDITDDEQALAWFTVERAALLGTITATNGSGLHSHCLHLADACSDFLDRQGHWHDWINILRTALASAQAVGDTAGQAQAHRDLGLACTRLNRLEDAQDHFHEAVALLRRIDDLPGLGRTYIHLSWLYADQERYAEGLDFAARALQLFTTAAHPVGRATALDTIVHHQTALGDHHQAVAHAQQALALFRALGDRHGEASALDNMGYAQHNLGRYQEAVTCFAKALELCRQVADRYGSAVILGHLGDTHLGLGDHDSARDAWQQAVTVFRELGRTEADAVQQKLAGLPTTTPSPE